MSWRAVARNDLREARRATGLLVLTTLLLLGLAGLAYALAAVADPDFDAYLDVTAAVVALLFPLVGVVLGSRAVAPERESGTIALLLSLPNSRRDVLVGKLAGRVAVLGGAFAVAAVGALVVLVVEYPGFDAVRYLGVLAAAFAYAVTFVSVGVALSAAVASSRRVVGAAFGAYVGLVLFWSLFVDTLVVVLFRFRADALVDEPGWAETATFASPRTAFEYLVAETVDAGPGPTDLVVDGQWFASPVVAAAVLLAWVLVPPVAGYLRFRHAEL